MLIFLVDTMPIPPAQMSEIVSQRIGRLDQMKATVSVMSYTAPLTGDPLDQSTWEGGSRPGDGGVHRITLVRPNVLDEAFTADERPSQTCVVLPDHVIKHPASLGRHGESIWYVLENPILRSSYSTSPVLDVFELQFHQTFVVGLNTLRLLQNDSTQVVRHDDQTTTYSSQAINTEWGGWAEDYDFDVNARGTPMRIHVITTALNGSGFTFEREMVVTSTTEVNGVEFPNNVVFKTTNSFVPHWAIDAIEISNISIDPQLTAESIRLEPATVNSIVYYKRPDLTEDTFIYGSDGNLASSSSTNDLPTKRHAFLGIVVGTACVSVIALGLISRRKRRATTLNADG